ncbi:site specific recombinase xerD [Caudoviricetes sp.]|nr:site specific recombinase xerD [Caudoviricetes sp.]
MTKTELTVEQLFCSTWNIYWNSERFQKSGRAYEVERIWKKDLAPTYGGLYLSQVTAGKVREWLRGYDDKKLGGNRALEVLARMFRHAEEMELRPQHTNPCALVKAFTEKKRKRFATAEEIQKIGEILNRDYKDNPRPVTFILVLMLTGARPKSIECSTWNNLEKVGDAGILTFHGKTTDASGEDEVVIIPPMAMKFLELLPKRETLVGIRAPRFYWEKIRREIGCADLWLRDLRRTFATIGMGEGEDMNVIGELLNHKSTQTTAIYAKLSGAKRFDTAMVISNKMAGILKLDGQAR